MEPLNATAVYTAERCEVWTSTQNGEAALAAVIEASGLPADKCEVHKTFLGTGFGRRGRSDYVDQAVKIAKQMPGTPIKLLWSREEDMAHGSYHPITQCRLTAGLDDKGNLDALHMRISGQSILAGLFASRLAGGKDPAVFQGLNPSGETSLGYSVDNLLIDHAMRNPHVPPGFWRGVNVNQNAIYVECFMDELAHATGQDPLAFRLKLMDKHPKNRAVLQAVAERAGWGKPAPEGVFIAASPISWASAAMWRRCRKSRSPATASSRSTASSPRPTPATPSTRPRSSARSRGSFVYGLSALIYGECTVKDGRMEQLNFDTYEVMRIREMPKVESIVMPSGGFWGGVGEPTICVAAPSVLNAIFAATGKRFRTFPLKNHGISMA